MEITENGASDNTLIEIEPKVSGNEMREQGEDRSDSPQRQTTPGPVTIEFKSINGHCNLCHNNTTTLEVERCSKKFQVCEQCYTDTNNTEITPVKTCRICKAKKRERLSKTKKLVTALNEAIDDYNAVNGIQHKFGGAHRELIKMENKIMKIRKQLGLPPLSADMFEKR